jgi:AraC-like DNA-binding protein
MWRPVPGDPVLCMRGRTTSYRVTPRGEYVFGVTGQAAMAAQRGRERWTVRPGQLVAWDPSGAHAGTSVDGTPWSARLIVVGGEELAMLTGGQALPEFPQPVLDDPALTGAFVRLHQTLEVGPSRLTRDELLGGWIRALMAAHSGSRSPAAGPAPRDERALRQARDYLAAHYQQAISLDDLAAVAGVGKFRLVRLFREHLGLTPHALQIAHRVRHARRLLEDGLGIAEAAAAAGFADQSHLHRHFRRGLGVTPRQYQRRF